MQKHLVTNRSTGLYLPAHIEVLPLAAEANTLCAGSSDLIACVKPLKSRNFILLVQLSRCAVPNCMDPVCIDGHAVSSFRMPCTGIADLMSLRKLMYMPFRFLLLEDLGT